ncbi:hypothetical protein HPULCUR_002553 [Helicostylum pulchrum]|uniref:J domain-containing protein n=1 Tax=Helicostylum pulchrum TaxID=562976 RepID=A0ABP9XQX1_9FUNG
MRICYYDLLSIERQATPLEIKKAYRKQALIWHPDKNGDRIQEATDRFSLIQEAYEVLSDPQERSWYDGHRDSILKGDDNKSQRDSSAGTSAEDLMRYFSISEFKGYQDTPKGFYNVFRSLFQKLADEEEEAYRNDPPEDEDDDHAARFYPSFGNANTPYADADGYLGYGAYVRDFYGTWANFTTCKSFNWMDKWRLSDAPTRIIRRGMEKENKKAREAGRKEYQDTVRSLAEFVRKRDPRVKAYVVEEQKRKEAVAAELKARLQREKLELQAKVADYKTPEWAKVVEEEIFIEEEEEEEEEEVSDFYCVVCEKSYRSEKQFETHENSKRHLENVEILRQEMLADEANFGAENIDVDLDPGVPVELDEVTAELDDLELQEPVATKKNKKKNKKKAAPRWGYDEEEVPEDLGDVGALAAALEEERNKRKKRGPKVSTPASTPTPTSIASAGDELVTESETATEATEAEAQPEKESAKEKRLKRKEKKKLKEESELTENDCNVCNEKFPTRNQLFSHIKDTGHALAIDASSSSSKKKKGGKRR